MTTTCQENRKAIGQSLNLCFDRTYRVELGHSFAWDSDAVSEKLAGPGLLVAFEVGDQGMLCLIPQSLPLPQWYTQPGVSEESRLQTLAIEWSFSMLPSDLEAGQFKSLAVDDLYAETAAADPLDWSSLIELLLFAETSEDDAEDATGAEAASDASDATEAAEPVAKLYVVCPVANPPFEALEAAADAVEAVSTAASPEAVQAAVSVGTRTDLLRSLPVTVSVRLAEKRIEMGQLLTLTPGALITFSKSCEDLLDLFVNNHIYCRGEAVKIGEKFGLKINEVGVEDVREEKVLNS